MGENITQHLKQDGWIFQISVALKIVKMLILKPIARRSTLETSLD
jgi:hypothetical protein